MKKLFKLFANFILVFAFGFSVQAQSVNGTVTDDNGVPLPGATVLVEGTQNGVSTDFDGNYSIDAASGDKLVFSYVGYSSQTVSVGNSATVRHFHFFINFCCPYIKCSPKNKWKSKYIIHLIRMI